MAEQEMSVEELMARGEEIYNGQCLACHGAAGEGGVGKSDSWQRGRAG
jgi:cytochrome c oxidase subunit 2